FNTGHGILPETPVDNVRAVVQLVREFKFLAWARFRS
ncbi:MAG: uroporphyrinogen decarboxylase family protein, partial [Bryobacteraceae bacterium]